MAQPDNSPDGFQEISPESIRALCRSQLASHYVETVFVSTDTFIDFDALGDIFDYHDRRRHQANDPVIGQFLRYVTNNRKPSSGVNDQEDKIPLK